MSTVSKGCCVSGCPNKTKHQRAPGEKVITFHKFPTGRYLFRIQQRNNWIEAVRKLDPKWTFNKQAVICSEHFREDDFHVNKGCFSLKELVVPSIFKEPDSQQENQTSRQQLENYNIHHNRLRKDSDQAWKPYSIYQPCLTEEGQPCLPKEEPVCSVEVKTEEFDPLDTTEAERADLRADSQLRLCRTCGAQQHRLVDIYGNEGREKNLSEKINKHLPIKVCVEDCLPLSLCVTCVELLEACSLIRESSQLQDDLLRSNLTQQSSAGSEEEQVSSPAVPPCEEVSDDDQREPAETEPLVDKPGTSGKQPRKRRRTVGASKDIQTETEGGRRKRKSRHTVEKEDNTNLSFAEMEERLVTKIADNEKIVTSEDEPPLLCCDECEEIFEEEHLYRVHQKHHEIRNELLFYKCNSCSERFVSSYLVKKHKLEIHPVVIIPVHMCEHCGKTFKRKDNLESHINHKHKPELPFMCHLCSKKFALLAELKLHIKNHDNRTCKLCNKTFKSYENLVAHNSGVHSKKSGKKNVCGSDKIPAKCPICKFVYRNQGYLDLHIQKKHPDAQMLKELKIKNPKRRRFKCYDCENTYINKVVLLAHMNTHTKEKIFKCKFCEKTSYHQYSIITHERSHKTERPFACTFCDRTFKLRYTLNIHIRTHTGEKPYKCDICGHAFAQRNDLKRHVARHNSNFPVRAPRKKLRCEDCAGTFASSKKLEEHQCRGGGGDSCDEDSVWHAQ